MPLILLNSRDTYNLSDVCSFPDVVSKNTLHLNVIKIICSHIGLANWFLFSHYN